MAKYDEFLVDTFNSSSTNIWELKFINTGRKVCGNESYQRAREWAQLPNKNDMIKYPTAEAFRFFIPHIPCVDSSFVCFRFRAITGKTPSSYEMGLPPIDMKTTDGRYDCYGEYVLYLSNSEYGAVREFCAQKLEGLPFADITNNSSGPFSEPGILHS